MMNKTLKKARNLRAKAAFASVAVASSMPAFATDAAIDTAVATAQTAAGTSVSAVVAGVITIVAIVVGAGLLISWMKKV
jgi:hypothetical protein